VLKRIDGRWQLTIPLHEVAAHRPDTVTRLIDIQIDRLSDREQRVLEVAAAAGATFTAAVIASALELDADRVDATCEALAKARHFLRAMGTETWPDGTVQYGYGFVHAMFQHAALARSSSASIRLWHRRFGERLESGYAADTDSIAAELAVHFEACHQYPKATAYYVDAGERAARRFGLSSALRHFARARELVSRLPTGDERDALELRVLRNLAPVSLVAQWERASRTGSEPRPGRGARDTAS
jgi:predicted ATPase